MTTTRDNSSRKRVLYLSYDGLTDALGQSQILPYLVGLAEYSSITLITFEKRDKFAAHGAQIRTICNAKNLDWIPLKYHKSPPVLSTLYDLFILRSTVKKRLSRRQFTALHCRSYLTSLIGLWAKRKFGLKFIFDPRGFWADERVEGGLWNLRNPAFRWIYSFFKRKERQFFENADHIVSLTESARDEIQSWTLNTAGISVIPTCVDMDLFNPGNACIDRDQLRRKLGIANDDFVLVYLGSWGTWYLTDEMLEFFAVLESALPRVKLLILTPDEVDLSGYRLASKIIVRKITRMEVPAHLAIAHATICFIKPAFSKKASSATKMAEAWAMNLPVVTNSGWGDIQRLKQSGLPLIMCDSKDEYPRVVSLLTDYKAENKREMLMGEFDLNSGVQKYRQIYESLDLL